VGRRRTPFSVFGTLVSLGALALLASAGACEPEDPVVNNPGDRPARTTSIYADIIISINSGGNVTSCVDGIPGCKDNKPVSQTGECAGNPALGKPDGKAFVLGPGDTLEFGILCDAIVEIGGTNGASDDFKLWATATGGAQPVVEVSLDGTNFVVTSPWPNPQNKGFVDNPGFQLEAALLTSARFVRVSNPSSKGMVSIDALEAFPVKRP
jgi:hypothetical protein